MKLHNEFVVPLPPRETWSVLNDVERVAPCFPGAKLLEARDDGSYVGTVSMRLGPVALSFKGTAVYEDVDEEAMRVRAKATGNEQRARGTARADVAFQVTPEGGDSSRVVIDTDLNLVGSIAQYARGGGMIETTAQVMIDDFARNLAEQISREKAAPATGADTNESAGPASAAPAAESRPPSLFRILWLAIKRRLFGSGK